MTHAQRLYLLFRAAALNEAVERARKSGEVLHTLSPYTPLGHAIEGYVQHEGEQATLYLRHPETVECDERISGAFRAFFESEFLREEAQLVNGWKVHRGHGHLGVSPFAPEHPPHDPRSSTDHPVRNPR